MNGIISIIVFVLILYGLFSIFDINYFSLSNQGLDFLLENKKMSIKNQIKIVKNKYKENFIVSEIKKANYILEVTGKKKQLPIIFSIACILVIVALAMCVALNNVYLMLPLCIGFFLVPFWVLEEQISIYKEELVGYIETALSIITTSYLRTENITTSIKENMNFIDDGLKGYFEEFITDATVNPDIEFALLKLKNRIQNKTFQEWVDAVISCQNNQMMKVTLIPIVRKMADLRIINSELNMLFARPKKNFLQMCIMLTMIVPIMGMINIDMMLGLFTTTIGKIALSISVGILFFCIHKVIKLIKPLED